MSEDNRYWGGFVRFDTIEKHDAGVLLGADCLVGDEYTVEFEMSEGKTIAYVVNKFDKRIGALNAKDSRRLNVLAARGWKIRALLSFVAYTEKGGEGSYWGEMGIIANDPVYNEQFDAWAKNVGQSFGDGHRVDVNVSYSGIQQIIETNGTWIPTTLAAWPAQNHGTAIVKKSRSMSEKMIEQGRKKNVGCYVVSWVFIIACLVGVGFLVKNLLGL